MTNLKEGLQIVKKETVSDNKMTGAEAIVKFLEKAGVEYVFGLCGHANLSMLDALATSSIKFIPVRNEQNAAHMADAYYRFSHKPGVVLTTIGPGLANAVTGVWEAAMDCSGVIVISGNVPSYLIGKDSFQELTLHSDASQADVYRPFVKRAWRIADPDLIPFVTQRAYNQAMCGRPGPVLIDVPMNYFSEVREYKVPDPLKHQPTGKRIRGDIEEIKRAAKLLVNAERPLIHVGNGATLSKASKELLALAEYLGIPITTSMQAQGIIDNRHVLSGAYPGAVGTPIGNQLCREADLVLSVGTRFSELETSSWDPDYSFQIGISADHIQVDIDPHEIGRVYPVTVGIIGDAAAVLMEILEEVKKLIDQRVWEERTQIQELIEAKKVWNEDKREAAISDSEPILVQRVIHELGEVIPENNILLTDAGTFRHGVGQYFPLRRPQSFFIPSGLGTMGGSAPAALGAKLAQPDKTVVCLIGDGGFSANDNALATAVESNIPVVWIVFNNYSWDSIETYQHIHFNNRVYGTKFQDISGKPYNPSFAKVAEGYGVDSIKVTSPAKLRVAIQNAISANKPYVIEVVVAPTRLKATGNWDVNNILKKEGDFKRERSNKAKGEKLENESRLF
jgi:acetolactate synthase I/II/III large subunit